ncbi:uncharacterized protein isoform X2 [Danio rerio]|uniref:Uncharacterized protein isoform X2 n=1 Tax=Danio rerio TaxID=7955 RepID=A0AC58JC14_DANRE
MSWRTVGVFWSAQIQRLDMGGPPSAYQRQAAHSKSYVGPPAFFLGGTPPADYRGWTAVWTPVANRWPTRVHYRAPFKHCSRERCHGNGATTRHLPVNSTSLMRQFSLISGVTKLPLQQKKRAKMKGANHRAGGNTDFGSSSTHSTTLFFLARLHSRIRKKPATRETAEGSLKDIFIRIC